jgi:hypothetical protein
MERVMVYSPMLWVLILAVVLLRAQGTGNTELTAKPIAE